MRRAEAIEELRMASVECIEAGVMKSADRINRVLASFDSMPSSAAAILGSKGGNTPTKPGSRPRGRPRKNAISETPSKAVE